MRNIDAFDPVALSAVPVVAHASPYVRVSHYPATPASHGMFKTSDGP